MINYSGNKPMQNTNSTLPNMANTITSWFLDVTFYTVSKKKQGALWVEDKDQEIKTKGVVQPPRDKDLKILPEGAWGWQWLMVHCLPDLDLEVNQFVYYDDVKYKVMAKKDWRKYGYIRYMLLEAYQAQGVSL